MVSNTAEAAEITVTSWYNDVINDLEQCSVRSSCRRTVWTHVAFGRFLYSIRDYGTLCL